MSANATSHSRSRVRADPASAARSALHIVAIIALAIAQPIAGNAAKAAETATARAPVEDRAADLEERLIDLQVQVATMRSLSADGQTVAALENELGALAAESGKLSGRPTAIQAAATTARAAAMAPGGGRDIDPRRPPDQIGGAPPGGGGSAAPGWFGSTTVTPNPDAPVGRPPHAIQAPNAINSGSDTRGELLPGNVFSDSAPGRTQAPDRSIAGWANPNPAPFAGAPATPGSSTPSSPQVNAAPSAPRVGAPPPSARNSADPETEYQTAYGLLLQQDYGAAQSAFVEFVSRHPASPLSGNAQYWIGETHYVRGAYKDAAVAFLQGFEKYGDGSKGPDSLLKLGLSLAKLNQTAAACSSLRELASRYRSAPVPILTRGRDEQRRLRCPAG